MMKQEDIFAGKTLLITGGTGSFGNAVLKRFLNTEIKEIRIFSRDEKKQDDMRRFYNNSKIKYYIGDVRQLRSVQVSHVTTPYPSPTLYLWASNAISDKRNARFPSTFSTRHLIGSYRK